MTNFDNQSAASETTGLVLHGTARYYDLLTWLFMRGREGRFREQVIDLARLQAGDRVLDIGCGTGTLAITAKRRVGPTGTVIGIDASPEMIGRASKKARKAGLDVSFQKAIVESLPFVDQYFDAVFSTLMLHHLPPKVRAECAREMRRVLRPGGRALVVDFVSSGRKNRLVEQFHRRHGSVKLDDIIEVLKQAGLEILESGAVGRNDTQFVLAAVPERK